MRKFVLFLALFAILGASFAGLTVKGGKKPVTDQETLDILTKSVGEHLKKLESQGKLELVEMHSATYQTVAGSLFEISAKLKENDVPVDCTIKMWEKPWIDDFLKFDVECGEEKRLYSYANGLDAERRKRNSPLAGDMGLDFKAISEGHLSSFLTKVSSAFDLLKSKYPEFDYLLKNIESGKSKNIAGLLLHSILQIEVGTNLTEKSKHCEIVLMEDLQDGISQVKMECEHDGKIFIYEKQPFKL